MAPFISIVLLTFNRRDLLKRAIVNFNKQINKNFELIVFDNGSYDTGLPERPEGYTVKFIKSEVNQHGDQALNAALQFAEGTYIFPFVADDDFFHPACTAVVEAILNKVPIIEILSLGYTRLNLSTGSIEELPQHPTQGYSGIIFSEPATEASLANASAWGIGKLMRQTLRIHGHSSGTLISRNVIDRTIKKQGALFLGPFPDIGITGCLFHTKSSFHLDLPLLIIGTAHQQSTVDFSSGTRKSWQRLRHLLKRSPLKACTHFNLALDSHLQVLIAAGYEIDVEKDIRFDFYRNHLTSIFNDRIHSNTTLEDFTEGYNLAKKIFGNMPSLRNYFEDLESQLRNIVKSIEHEKSNAIPCQTNNEPRPESLIENQYKITGLEIDKHIDQAESFATKIINSTVVKLAPQQQQFIWRKTL